MANVILLITVYFFLRNVLTIVFFYYKYSNIGNARVAMKYIMSFLVFVCLCHGVAGGPVDLSKDEIIEVFSEKISDGILNRMEASLSKDVVSAELVVGTTTQSILPFHSWAKENIEWVTKPFIERMGKDLDEMNGSKIRIINKYLEPYAAFKASVYSSYPPCKEVGEIIASNIARAILWANREEVPYPSIKERYEAKRQIHRYFDKVQAYLHETLDFHDAKLWQEIRKSIIEGYLWRVDMPFCVQGKKILQKNDMDKVFASFQAKFEKKYLDTERGDVKEYLQSAEKVAAKRLVSSMFTLASQQLARFYYKGMDRIANADENERIMELLEKLQEKTN